MAGLLKRDNGMSEEDVLFREKSRVFKYRILSVQIFIILTCLMLYFFLSNDTYNKYNPVNIFIFCISLIICLLGINDIRKNGIRTYNVFLLSFYLFLLWNTLNISSLQFEKEFSDLYYYFVGPLLFSIFIFIGDRLPIKETKIVDNKVNKRSSALIILVFVIYLLLSYYIYTQVGLKIFSDKLLRYTSNDEYAVPGFSGLAYTLMWTMIIFVPHMKKYLNMLIVPFIVLYSGVLQFNRGNIFRIVLFMIIYYCYKKGKSLLEPKKIVAMIVVISILIIFFGYIGEVRQTDINNVFDIKDLTQSSYNSKTLNWIYNYTAMNFDVIKIYFNLEPYYLPSTLLVPFMRLIGNREYVLKYYSPPDYSLGITNSSTFLSGFIRDYGSYYLIELSVFGFMICLLQITIRKLRFMGLYFFVQMYIVFFFFGNYLTEPLFLSVAIFSLFLYICCNLNLKALQPGLGLRRSGHSL